MKIRLASSVDQAGIIKLIDSVLAEHNDRVCLEDSEKDLLDIEKYYFQKNGAFWVLEDTSSGKILGTHGAVETTQLSADAKERLRLDCQKVRTCVFKRLYLAKQLRGSQWGRELMQTTVDWAKTHNLERIEFWSDTRFERAHRFFEKFGFQSSGEVRTMNDSHETYAEIYFFMEL